MTVLLRRFHASALVALVVSMLVFLCGTRLFAQSGASAPDRIVSPVRTDLPGRTVWAFATTGTGTNITTFAATDKGLYKSSGGAWSLTTLDKQSVYAVKSRRVGNVTTLLVGTDKGVLRSTDGGNTWVSPEVTTGTVSTSNIVALKKVFDIEVVQPGNGNGSGNASVWFAATDKGVYRSTNDGRSWSLVNIDRTADNNEVRGITVDGNTIIVNLWREGLWRSTNNGNSWTKLSVAGETALCRAVHAQQGTNATVWLAGSVSGNIWRSTNNGNSWTRVYQGTSAARSIVASSLSQAGIDAFTGWERPGTLGERWIYLFATTPTGIAYSLNEGLSWKLSRTPSSEKAVSLVAWNNKLFVGTEAERSIGSAVKEGAQLQNTTGGTNEYDATCTDGCSGGGSGSGSNNTAVIGAPVLTRTAPRIYLTPSTTSPGNYSIAEQLQVYGSGIFEIGGFPLDATVTRASTGQVLTRGIFYGIGDFSANGGGWFNGEQYGTFSFSTALPSDNYGIQIRNISGLSNTIFFAVGPSFDDLTFTGVSANSNIASSPVTMVISGTGIDQWTQLLIDNQTPQNIVYTYRNPNGYSMTVTFVAPSDGGNHTLTLQRGTSTTQSRTWTIASPIPALSSVTTDPSPARVGQTATMTIGGQKFASDAQVRIYGPNNTVTTYNPTTRTGTTGMTVSSFTPPTTPGVYAVDVVNPGASSPSEQTTYMVAYPAPTLTAISPTRIIQNLSATLSLTGTGILTGVTEFGLSSGLSSTLSGASVTFTAPAKGTYSASLTNATTYGGGGTATLSNALTVVAPNPAPASLTLDSTRLLVNDGVRTITITGTGFLTGSNSDDNARTTVTVDGAPVTPQSISATQIVLNVPTAGANAGNHTIALTNPAVFGMASGGGGTASTTYSVVFPPPTLTSLDADSLDLNIGTSPQTLTLTGTGFVNASRVFAVGQAQSRELTVSSRTATSLVVTIPAGFFTEPTTVAVRVDNPVTSGVTPTDGGSSATKTLTIKNLLPTLTSINPAPVVAGENATLTLTGSNFIANTSLVFAGSTALVTTVSSANSLTATLPASLVADIGTLSLTVRNTFGTDIKTSLPKSLRIIHPTPEVTSLAPVTIPAFDSTQTLTITGAKFAAASMVPTRARVVWSKNGVETPLTLLPNPTATQLRVTVPAALLTELGTVTVRVQNVDSADAQGGPSASSTLTIIPPRPVVTSVMPNSATAGAGAVTVSITGAKFIQSGLSILIRNAQNGFVRGLLNPTFTSNTSVSGMIPADVASMAGNYTITVVNAANAQGQGGGESTTSAPFTILNPAPTISSLTPNPATVFAPFTLEIQGTGFVSGATSVTVDGQVFAPASVTVLSSVRLTVNVAAITSAKNASVSVTNPKLNNQGGGTATTTLPVVPPVPTVSQAQGNAGSGTLTRNIAGTLTVTGTGFVTGAVIIFNGQDLTTTVVDQTTVRANVAASALPTQGVYAVAVRNPQFGNQGGGTSSPVVGVTVQNPTPTLSGISPTAVTRGNDVSITLTGSNFYDGAVAYLSGASASTFATVFVNNGSLTLSIPASSLPVAGSYSIAVKNAEPTPGFSGTRTLTVNNPAPVLSSLPVTETEAYSSDVTVAVTGSGFENGLLAWWTPSGASRQALPAPTSVSANSCTLTLPAALLKRAGAFTITLENVAPSLGASAPATFTVLDRVPTLTSVTPNPIEALSGNTQITLTGDYFAPSADALWNGEILTRVSVNRTTLVATVPASRLTLATVAQITVRNPQFSGRGGGTSTPAQNLVITNPTPRLTSLTPAFTVAVTSGTGAVVTLNGTAFMPVSTVEMSVSDSTGTPSGVWSVVPSTYQSSSRMSVLLPDALLHQPVVLTLRVVSPQVSNQGGGTSEERLFTVRAPVPVLTLLVPTVATLNAQTGDVLVRVEGANFTNTSLVRVANVPVPTRYLSPTALEATVQRPAAAYTVTVNNPPVNAQGGGTSSGLRLVIVNPVPTLTSVQPATLASTGAPDTLMLKGTNFITGVKVLYNGTALAAASVVVVNAYTLRVLIPTLPIAVTTHTLAVQQPSVITGGETFGGGASQTLPLQVVFPVPTLTSLSPASTAATLNPNAALNHWTLTVRGTLFASNAVVLWNGQTLTTNVVNNTTLRALVPNSLAHDSGTVAIRVKNNTPIGQGGGTSADSLALGLYYPVPVLTGIAPEFTTAATLTRLTLTGTNFAPGSGVQLAATFLPAVMLGNVQVISPTEVRASIPASLLSTRGTYSVRVISPQTASAQGGGQSAAKTLTAVNPAPVLTALLPNTTTASGKAWTLTLVGHSFTSTSQVRYNGVLQSVVNTDFIPNVQADTLRVKLPAVPVNDTTFFLSVFNPPSTVNGQSSGGGESDTLRLTIGLPSPTITSISPTTTTATLGDRVRVWTLTINGTFFDNTAKVFVSGVEVPSEFVAATRLRVVLPDSMQFYQARRTVQVRNTPTLTSNIVSQTVQNPAPVLTAMNPSTILAGRDTTLVFAGDRFAPNSTVRLTYGTTTTILTPTLRDSVIGLTVTVPGALTRTKGAYTLRVSNPALTPTMVPPDTLLLGGGLSAAQTLTVNAGGAVSVEYIGLDTLLYAGDRLWFFTLRFRDAVGNLVDNDPVTLTYTNIDTASTNGASVTGTFPMTRTSLGNYRADTLRFPVAGTYELTVDTTQTGALTVIGANRFTVLTRPAVRVEMTGLKETLSAGETQHVQVRYYDNQNNLTDNSVRPVIVTAPLSGGYRYVLGYTRLSTGVYDMETVRYTTSGNYTISFTGIDTLNITGNGVPYNRRFTVQTIPAASVRFTNVNPLLTAGNAQNRFTAAFRDTFGNLTDALTTEQLVVQYSNSTTASVGDRIVSGAITLSRLSLGTYQADIAERFPVVGSYNFTVQGINSTSGTAAFRVQPAGDARVEFAGVRDTLVAGDSLQNVTLTYWDVNGNLTDNNLGDIILTKRTAPTFPARMAKTRISTGVYAVQTTQATVASAYDLTVVGISAANTSGNNRFVLVPASVTSAKFVISTGALTKAGAKIQINAAYKDQYGNDTDVFYPIDLQNTEFASVATVTMQKQKQGQFAGSAIVFAPGDYAIVLNSLISPSTILSGDQIAEIEPGPATRADFSEVLSSIQAGEKQSAFAVTFRDRKNQLTDLIENDIIYVDSTKPFTGKIPLSIFVEKYGTFRADPTAINRTGKYTLSANGIVSKGTQNFTVQPNPATRCVFSNVPTSITAGGTLDTIQISFFDQFGNAANCDSAMQFKNSTETVKGKISLRRIAQGIYQAISTYKFAVPDKQYTLSFPNITGEALFRVNSTIKYKVEFVNVPDSIALNSSLPEFQVIFKDSLDARIDVNVGVVQAGIGTSIGLLKLERISKGFYRVLRDTTLKFYQAGIANLITVPGLENSPSATTRFYVKTGSLAKISSYLSYVDLVGNRRVTFSTLDAANNLIPFPNGMRVRFTHQEVDSIVITVPSTRVTSDSTSGFIEAVFQKVGIYNITIPDYLGNLVVGTVNFRLSSLDDDRFLLLSTTNREFFTNEPIEITGIETDRYSNFIDEQLRPKTLAPTSAKNNTYPNLNVAVPINFQKIGNSTHRVYASFPIAGNWEINSPIGVAIPPYTYYSGLSLLGAKTFNVTERQVGFYLTPNPISYPSPHYYNYKYEIDNSDTSIVFNKPAFPSEILPIDQTYSFPCTLRYKIPQAPTTIRIAAPKSRAFMFLDTLTGIGHRNDIEITLQDTIGQIPLTLLFSPTITGMNRDSLVVTAPNIPTKIVRFKAESRDRMEFIPAAFQNKADPNSWTFQMKYRAGSIPDNVFQGTKRLQLKIADYQTQGYIAGAGLSGSYGNGRAVDINITDTVEHIATYNLTTTAKGGTLRIYARTYINKQIIGEDKSWWNNCNPNYSTCSDNGSIWMNHTGKEYIPDPRTLPSVRIDTNNISFGTIKTDTNARRTVTVAYSNLPTNTKVDVFTIWLGDPTPPFLLLDSSGNLVTDYKVVKSGTGTFTATLVFSPRATGVQQTQMGVIATLPNNTTIASGGVYFSGVGTISTTLPDTIQTRPRVTASPTVLDFGDVRLDSTVTANVHVDYSGFVGNSLNILLPSANAGFAILNPQGQPVTQNPYFVTINSANGSFNIPIRFRTSTSGVKRDSIRLRLSNNPSDDVIVYLLGASATPTISAVQQVAFGNAYLGTDTIQSLALMYRNFPASGGAITVTPPGTEFTVLNPATNQYTNQAFAIPVSSAAGAVTLSVKFQGRASGTRTGSLTLAAAGAPTITVALAANVLAPNIRFYWGQRQLVFDENTYTSQSGLIEYENLSSTTLKITSSSPNVELFDGDGHKLLDSITVQSKTGSLIIEARFTPNNSKGLQASYLKVSAPSEILTVSDSTRVLTIVYKRVKLLLTYTQRALTGFGTATYPFRDSAESVIRFQNNQIKTAARRKLLLGQTSLLDSEIEQYSLSEDPFLVNYSEVAPIPHLYIDIDNLSQLLSNPSIASIHNKMASDTTIRSVILLVNTIGKPYQIMTSYEPTGQVLPRYIIIEHFALLPSWLSFFQTVIGSLQQNNNLLAFVQSKDHQQTSTLNPSGSNNGKPQETQTSLNNLVKEKRILIKPIASNPFSDISQIHFELFEPGQTQVIIYDSQGRELVHLANEFLDVGSHTVIWNASSIKSGMYWCRVISGNSSAITNIAVVR